MKYVSLTTLCCLLLATTVSAQQQNPPVPSKASILEEGDMKNAFDEKKFRVGISLNMYWNTIMGPQLSEQYFWKPGLGGTIRAEYYPINWIGVSTGVGFQQTGGGVINEDISGGAFSHPWIVNKFGNRGDPDSTHLEKLRISVIEVPLMLVLRTPMDVLQPGWRVSGGFGVNVMKVMEVNNIWNSIVDGFHDDHYVKEDYLSSDLGLIGALGMDIDSGTGQMFQVQFVYMRGTKNVYKTFPGTGYQVYSGIRFSWLF
jgi:hypothetical protein